MGTGSSLSRTGISVGAGASSRLGGVFARLWLGLIVLLFGSIAELVPLSVIAGMLFVIGAELIVGRLLHLVPTKDGKFEESAVPEVYPVNQVTVLVFEGNIFFAKFPLYDQLLPSHPDVNNAVVILRARYQESASSTALKWLERYAADLRGSDNLLMLAGVASQVMQKFEKAGRLDFIGKENVFAAGPVLEASLDEALDAAAVWLKNRDKDS